MSQKSRVSFGLYNCTEVLRSTKKSSASWFPKKKTKPTSHTPHTTHTTHPEREKLFYFEVGIPTKKKKARSKKSKKQEAHVNGIS